MLVDPVAVGHATEMAQAPDFIGRPKLVRCEPLRPLAYSCTVLPPRDTRGSGGTAP